MVFSVAQRSISKEYVNRCARAANRPIGKDVDAAGSTTGENAERAAHLEISLLTAAHRAAASAEISPVAQLSLTDEVSQAADSNASTAAISDFSHIV
jgi:hypothetical protein